MMERMKDMTLMLDDYLENPLSLMMVLLMALSFQQTSWEILFPASVDSLADCSIDNSEYLWDLEPDQPFHPNLASYKMGSKHCKGQRSKILLAR